VGGIGLEQVCHSRSLQQAEQSDSFSASDSNIGIMKE
jgi:hypothetical protein